MESAMIEKLDFKVLVGIEDVKPSHELLKVIGVFNPAAVRFGDDIMMLARVAETAKEEREGYMASPWYDFSSGSPVLKIDWIPCNPEVDRDSRKKFEKPQRMRLAFISHLRLIKIAPSGFDVVEIDDTPTFYPHHEYEEFGVEDPRLSEIDGRFYFTYVAVSQKAGVCTAMASTAEFKKYTRHGIIFCRENKDVVILPGKFNGKYCAYHRPVGGQKTNPPNMMSAFSPNLIHWGEHKVLMDVRPGYFDQDRMGGGTTPVKTEKGWLEIYHGVTVDDPAKPAGTYRAGTALFDLEDPTKLIARSAKPIMSPEDKSETDGFVANVTFPTAAVLGENEDDLLIYSGGADTVVTVTKLSLRQVMESLEYI